MIEKKPIPYQGRDWFTHRWTLAEAFDFLDRIHDLCLCRNWTGQNLETEDGQPLLPMILDLIVNLEASVHEATSDTIPSEELVPSAAHFWAIRELHWRIKELEQSVRALIGNKQPDLDLVIALLLEIKKALKGLDT